MMKGDHDQQVEFMDYFSQIQPIQGFKTDHLKQYLGECFEDLLNRGES